MPDPTPSDLHTAIDRLHEMIDAPADRIRQQIGRIKALSDFLRHGSMAAPTTPRTDPAKPE